ncbi:barstar family protein [Streptomyces sp. NPDC047525]|uniref:barstar family protein n=1 Tax=Streptomyces sp. NPDC047525 TaxID=3155264 RepID=UPI003407178E
MAQGWRHRISTPDFDVTGTSPPWVVFTPKGTAQMDSGLSTLAARGGRVHHFPASALMTEQGIYGSFAEALQFPSYFGRNWDAMVDCLDDLCGAVTGRVGIAGVIHDADPLLETANFPLLVSVLCQAADRANSGVDLDGFPLDRPAIAEHFIFEFNQFDQETIRLRVDQPDLLVTTGDGFVAAALDPEEWR